MSGTSYQTDCPRCGGKGTLQCSSDYRPFDGVAGECLRCGFNYWTAMGMMGKDELELRRVDYDVDVKDLKQIADEERELMESFDKNYGLNLEENKCQQTMQA